MKLTHPDAPETVIEPKAEHADEYKSQGWTEVAEKAPEKPVDKK